jgi:cellulose synthase/poly-beta-1,6-N-acetylglucosamine synthase-like glycosyltransferase
LNPPPFARAEIIVCVDTDSHLQPHAIWEIVQPLADPEVGAVAGTVLARNAETNLCTWLQAAEYLRTIFVGRMLSSRLGVLGIVSGAFGAFRREAVERLKGWDVGPGEDGDLVLRLRRRLASCMPRMPSA